MISLQKVNELLHGYFPWMRGNEHAVVGTACILAGMILLLLLSLALITKFMIFSLGIIAVYSGLSLLGINPLDNMLRALLNKFLNNNNK
jgi:hypothetical protein